MTKRKNRFLYFVGAILLTLCVAIMPFVFNNNKGSVFADSSANTFVGSKFVDTQMFTPGTYQTAIESAYTDFTDYMVIPIVSTKLSYSFGYHTGANNSDTIVVNYEIIDEYFKGVTDTVDYRTVQISNVDFGTDGFYFIMTSASDYINNDSSGTKEILPCMNIDGAYDNTLLFAVIKGNATYFSPSDIVGVSFYDNTNLPSYTNDLFTDLELQYDGDGNNYYSQYELEQVCSSEFNVVDYFTASGSHLLAIRNYYTASSGPDTYYLYGNSRTYYFPNAFDSAFTNGYNSGYNAGENAGYSSGYSVGQSDGYDSGVSVGYNNGYTAGVQFANQYSFEGLLTAVIDTPIFAVMSLLDFEILGVQLNSFMLAIFSFCLILAILRMIKK